MVARHGLTTAALLGGLTDEPASKIVHADGALPGTPEPARPDRCRRRGGPRLAHHRRESVPLSSTKPPPVSTIYIERALVNPSGSDPGLETVVLGNRSTTAQTLANWRLVDRNGRATPIDATLPPGASLDRPSPRRRRAVWKQRRQSHSAGPHERAGRCRHLHGRGCLGRRPLRTLPQVTSRRGRR